MRYLTYLMPFLFLLLTSCGGGAPKDKNQPGTSQNKMAKAASSSQVRTIDIIGVDQMKFVVKDDQQKGIVTGETVGPDKLPQLKTIIVSPGEKIRIRLTNNSKLPATAMSHNFILLKRTADPEAFDQAAMHAKDNDYIPSSKADQIIAHTGLVSGGETKEVTFTAPEQIGENEFICSFPGHFSSGMKGILEVE